MKNVVGQAIDEFNYAIANTTATSNMTSMMRSHNGINRSMSGSMSSKIKIGNGNNRSDS